MQVWDEMSSYYIQKSGGGHKEWMSSFLILAAQKGAAVLLVQKNRVTSFTEFFSF